MRLNNEGVQLLQTGSYTEAVKVFSQVLATVKGLLSEENREQEWSMEEGEAMAESVPFCHFKGPKCQMDFDEVNTSGELFLFQRALVVDYDTSSSTMVHFNSLVKLSSISLYNLALSYHMGALEMKTSRKMFRKALTFYELAHSIQTPEELDLGVLLTLAIVNNIGHIHSLLNNKSKAEQCFQHLLSTIMYVTDCGEGEALPQFDGFFSNVMNSVLKQQPSAPAA
jgi:tetratricopeptide (TPR) repeat protein